MTILAQMASNEGQPDVKVNENFEVTAPAGAFGRRYLGITGTTWAYYGGVINLNGYLTVIDPGTVSLTAFSGGTANYIQMNPSSGAITATTLGFTPGFIPLYSAIANATTNSITSFIDYRSFIQKNGGTISVTIPDSNTTLSFEQVYNAVIIIAGTLSANRTLTFPVVDRGLFTVYNKTNFPIIIIGNNGGSSVQIASLKTAIVFSDGVTFIRATADA